MMKKLRTFVAAFFALSLMLTMLASCGDPSSIEITRISLTKKFTMLTNDEPKTVTATVEPELATADDIEWSVAPAGIITLTVNGFEATVAPVGVGTATITVTAKNFPDIKGTTTVTVEEPSVRGITLDKTSMTLAFIFNASEQITATPTADVGADSTVTWSSEDETIATVSSNGTVTAVSEGSTIITATAGEKTATCEVSVKVPKEIRTTADFRAIGKDEESLSGFYFMSADLDFAGESAVGPLAPVHQGNDEAASIVGFTGYFDGCGYSIKNAQIGQRAGVGQSGANGNRASLFGNIAKGAVVKNLAVVDFTMSANGRRSGTLANFVFGTIENIYLKGTASFTNTENLGAGSWDRNGAIIAGLRAGGVLNNVVADIDTSGSAGSGVIAAVNLQHAGASSPSVGLDATASNIFVVMDKVKVYSATGDEPASPASVYKTEFTQGLVLIGIDQTGTGYTNLQTATTLFENKDLATIDFSKLPSELWANNVATGASALPTLKTSTVTPIAVTAIELEENAKTLPIGALYAIAASAKPASASYPRFVYSIEAGKEAIATLDTATGVLTAVGNGTAVVTVSWANDPAVKASFTVTVDSNMFIEPTGVFFDEDQIDLWVGASGKTNWIDYAAAASGTLTAKVTSIYDIGDSLAASQDVTWASSDATVATVVDGVVTALKAGTTTIKATAVGSTEFAECEVAVRAPIQISTADEFLAIGGTKDEALKERLSGVYVLTQDIDFEGKAVAPIGDQEHNPSGNTHTADCDVPYGFRGIFDGKGYSLKNFTLSGSGYNNALFPGLYGGVIRNLGIENATVDGGNRSSLLVNSLYGGVIENIFVSGEIKNASPANEASYANGGTIFGGTGDAANTLMTSSGNMSRPNMYGNKLTVRNVVTDVTVSGSNTDRTYAVAARIGQNHTATTVEFENLFVVADGLATARQTGNVARDGNTLVESATKSFLKAGIATVAFDKLDADAWQLNAGALPTLKKGMTPTANVTIAVEGELPNGFNWRKWSGVAEEVVADGSNVSRFPTLNQVKSGTTVHFAIRGGSSVTNANAYVIKYTVDGGAEQTLNAVAAQEDGRIAVFSLTVTGNVVITAIQAPAA